MVFHIRDTEKSYFVRIRLTRITQPDYYIRFSPPYLEGTSARGRDIVALVFIHMWQYYRCGDITAMLVVSLQNGRTMKTSQRPSEIVPRDAKLKT